MSPLTMAVKAGDIALVSSIIRLASHNLESVVMLDLLLPYIKPNPLYYVGITKFAKKVYDHIDHSLDPKKVDYLAIEQDIIGQYFPSSEFIEG